jgi:hypothetical protein
MHTNRQEDTAKIVCACALPWNIFKWRTSVKHSVQVILCTVNRLYNQMNTYGKRERIWTLTFNKALLNCLNPDCCSGG